MASASENLAYYALGAKEYENALRHFKSIADAYPNNRFSKQAVSMVRLIDQKQKAATRKPPRPTPAKPKTGS